MHRDFRGILTILFHLFIPVNERMREMYMLNVSVQKVMGLSWATWVLRGRSGI